MFYCTLDVEPKSRHRIHSSCRRRRVILPTGLARVERKGCARAWEYMGLAWSALQSHSRADTGNGATPPLCR